MLTLKGVALRCMVIMRLEIGWQLMMLLLTSLLTRKPTPCSCFSSLPLKYIVWPSCVCVSPMFFHLTSQSPITCHSYLLISCTSSSTLPAALNILTFQVPIVMFLLVRIESFLSSLAHFSPLPWCATGGAVLGDPGDDRSGMEFSLVVISSACRRQKSLAEPIPHQALTLAKILLRGGSPWSRVHGQLSWNKTPILAVSLICVEYPPYGAAPHRPLTWFSMPAEARSQGIALGANMWESGDGWGPVTPSTPKGAAARNRKVLPLPRAPYTKVTKGNKWSPRS